MSLGLLDPGEDALGAPGALEGVGPVRRGVARAIDLVVLQVGLGGGAAAACLLALLLADLLGPGTAAAVERLVNAASASWRGSLADAVLGLVGVTLVHTLAEGIHGSTIGKRICGITVVSEDGSPAGLVAGLKRSLGFLLDQFVFGLVGVHRILNSPLQQRLGDEWAGTRVVRLRELPAASRRSTLRFLAVAGAAVLVSGAIGFLGTLGQIRHHARLLARDAVEIVAVSRKPGQDSARGRERTVAVQVRYTLRSAPEGTLQVFVLREIEPAPQGGRHHVARGSGSVALAAEVRLPPGPPDEPDDVIFVGLFPDLNQEQPSAIHAFDLRLVECGPRGETDPGRSLCAGRGASTGAPN